MSCSRDTGPIAGPFKSPTCKNLIRSLSLLSKLNLEPSAQKVSKYHSMDQAPFKVLIFSRTKGFRHESIPAGIAALQRLAESSTSSSTPFSIEATEDPQVFNSVKLSEYRVIVFLQASGNFLDDDQQLDALKRFVREGGGIVGIHCASTGMPSSEWYGHLIGGVFTEHPDPQDGRVTTEDSKHAILSHDTASTGVTCDQDGCTALVRDWHDEWYNFKVNPRSNKVHVLLTVDESTYHGGSLGDDHPIAWCQEFECGRSFYTALGHFDEAYQDNWFLSQVLNGILWTSKII